MRRRKRKLSHELASRVSTVRETKDRQQKLMGTHAILSWAHFVRVPVTRQSEHRTYEIDAG